MADQHLPSAPEVVNLELLSGYDTGPEALHAPEPDQGCIQKEPARDSGLEKSKGTIWGMKRKTFMIVIGIIAILIIAMAAGVGWGVGVTATKSERQDSPARQHLLRKFPQIVKT